MTLLDETATRPDPEVPLQSPVDWIDICAAEDLDVDRGVGALVEGEPVAIFRCSPWDELFAIGNIDPYSSASVLSRGIICSIGHRRVVASPVFKNRFDLQTGRSLDDPAVRVATYGIRTVRGRVQDRGAPDLTTVGTATGVARAFSSPRNVRETRSKHRAATLTSLNLGALSGYTIGITADRRWQEQAELLERRGARVQHGPSIRTFPLFDEEGLRAATQAVVDHPPDIVVLITALGTRGWLAAAESNDMGDQLHAALSGARVYARGPKAAGAALTASLDVTWKAPDAKTSQITEHLINELAPNRNGGHAPPLRVAVQLDGSEDRVIAEELIAAGFDVVQVPIYKWTMPIDPAPACRLAQAVADATIDAVTFTAGPALSNFVALATQQGCLHEMLASFNAGRVAAVCVGPVCAEKAHRLGITRTIEPNHPRLGAMVQACASAFSDRGTSFSLAGHELCMQGRVVLIDDDEPIALSDRERDVLEVLAGRPGAVHSKAALLTSVWGDSESDEHVVEVTVGRLRQRLGEAGSGIETVVRRGYRLAAD